MVVINAFEILLVVILYIGVWGSFRGVRAFSIMTGAIFFALVVLLVSGDIAVQFARQIGLPLIGVDSQDVFKIILFLFIVAIATFALGRITTPPGPKTRADKLWGLGLGLLNGFLIAAVIDRYLTDAIQSASPLGTVSVGIPSVVFAHPSANTWQVSFVSNTVTLLPSSGPSTNLWTKVPYALLLLLLFLAFVFVATLYGRLNRSKGRG